MKKLFIIGTGRNGSKLTGRIVGTSVPDKNRFGEIHHGLNPIFFKSVYDKKISHGDAVNRFKNSRDGAMKGLTGIYVEKNHLIVPILNVVLEAYPDAEFLYVARNPKDIIRSLYSRNVYTGEKNIYEDGRLVPNRQDAYYNKWTTMGKFEKVCWYVYTMVEMITTFINKIGKDNYRIIHYEVFTSDPTTLQHVCDWIGVEYDIDKIKNVLSRQIGSSARSSSELNFKIDIKKIKGTQHWSEWPDKKKKIYRSFFGEW